MPIFYVDGQFLPAEQAVISVQDLAVLRGYGVFDFMRTYGGKPFHLEDHIRRLINSAEILELELPCSPTEMAAITRETLTRNALPEASVRLVITGGFSPDSITPQQETKFLVLVMPLSPCPRQWYIDGVKVITIEDQRFLPIAKSINYSSAILALNRARRQGATEAIYTDSEGYLLEGTTSNFFAFIGDKLVTPGESVLPGVTQRVILESATKAFTVENRNLHRDEIADMSEAFISASNKEVVPVVRIDEMSVGTGVPGERTRRIMALFSEYTKAFGG